MKSTKELSALPLLVIVGATSSGKSELALTIAERYEGEVISADSRQVYRGMNLGSGKLSKKEMRGIPHHLIDVASPKRTFTVAQYRAKALKALQEIEGRGKLPIVCGGSHFYIQALVDGILFPRVKPDRKLRESLNRKTTEELYRMLTKLDPERAQSIEKKNPRRLIRAIEICLLTGSPVPPPRSRPLSRATLWLAPDRTFKYLHKRMEKRLDVRLRKGLVKEVRHLNKQGISFQRLEGFGLEYKAVALYLQGDISYEDMKERILLDTMKLAKRQLQWWKKDKRIRWVKNKKEALGITRRFLSSLRESS